jgi:two-component system, cell cycle sensor histidine kinase and response regulator CckA
MPAGGRLTISTHNPSVAPAGANGSSNDKKVNKWIALEVSDSGCGMDEQVRNHIFEPFFTTKPLGKGTGLGLPTVYDIVHQFGGHIQVESKPGFGSCFQLCFPLASPPANLDAVGPAAEASAGESQRLSILLADDEPGLRQALAEYLRTAGHEVHDAHNPLDALELARRHAAFDVLITDIVMPELRGTQLAREVSKLQPGIQVIYMSGYAEGFLEGEFPAEATFFQKPFRFATLLEQLKLIARKV